ncbi:MAG: nucleotidyltransferase family protein [Chloroflexota bacterium]
MFGLITAGGHLKKDDPLFIETGIDKKALIPIEGKPMGQWVADALLGSDQITGLVVVGLKTGQLQTESKSIHYVEDHGGIVENVLAGVDYIKKMAPDCNRILLSSSDIPLITTDIVHDFIDTCLKKEGDLIYTVVEQVTMESRFPNSNRTFTRLKGGSYTGGDLMMLDSAFANPNLDLFRGATGNRKNFLAQAKLIGFTFIFRFIFRLMDLVEAEERAKEALNISGHILSYHRAEIAMDVDKIHHYHLVKDALKSDVTDSALRR